LSPGGSIEAICAAVEHGADAVYFGIGPANARVRAANIAASDSLSVVSRLHDRGVKAYTALNVPVQENTVSDLASGLAAAWFAGADAVILRDPLLIEFARTRLPGLAIHASTQAGVLDVGSAARARDAGCVRAILARELSLAEIRAIHKAVPDLELEAFVFGALCFGVSGRCLLGESVGSRSGNYGQCLQACRLEWFQRPEDEGNGPGRSIGRPFSMKDLDFVQRIPELAAAGISSLKIEGRLKSPAWVGCVTSWVRMASRSDEPLDPEDRDLFDKHVGTLFARPRSDAYLDGKTDRCELTCPEVSGHEGLEVGDFKVTRSGGDALLTFVSPVDLSIRDGLMLSRRGRPVSIRAMLDSMRRSVQKVAAGQEVTIPVGHVGSISRVAVHSANAVEAMYAPSRQVLAELRKGHEAAVRPKFLSVAVGQDSLRLKAVAGRFEFEHVIPLESCPARGSGLSAEMLSQHFGTQETVRFSIAPGLYVNPSTIKAAKRSFCAAFEEALRRRSKELADAARDCLESRRGDWIAPDAKLALTVPLCVSRVTGFGASVIETSGRNRVRIEPHAHGTRLLRC